MEYRIQRGDTLWALSRRFDTTVDAIVGANRDTITDPDRIYAGDTITIPERARPAADAAADVQPSTAAATPARAQAPADAAAGSRQVAPAPPTRDDRVVAASSPDYASPQPTAYVAPQTATHVAPRPTTFVAPVTTAATATAPTRVAAARSSYEDHPFEQRVLDLVNQVRASYGLHPVAWNAALNSEAEAHVAHMSRVDRMAHDSIGDGTPGQRMRAHGWSRAWGENVAVGQTSPEQVVREWMASPGHRANILNPSFSYLSVAYGTNAQGRPYWGQAFGA